MKKWLNLKSIKHAFIIAFVFNFLVVNAQNKIDKSKKELNAGSTVPPEKAKSSRRKEIDSEDVGLFLEIAGYVTFGVFKYGLIGDYANEDHLYNNLSPYPYFKKGVGNFCETDTTITKKFRLEIENNFVYSSNNFLGNHIEGKIRPIKYFYLKTDFYQLFEFNDFDNSTDRLSLFYFNLGYDRIRFERFNLGWTAGASYVGNGVKKGGFSYGVNAEYFLEKKISFVGEVKWSRINYKPVNSLKIQSKFFKNNYYLSLSYERLKIASPIYNLIGIGGGIYF